MNSFPIEQQKLLIAIHREDGGAVADALPTFATGGVPPDDSTTNVTVIDNLVDGSDFDFSKDGYLNTTPVGGDVALEVYNYFRNLLIKVSDVVATSASPTITSATAPFKAAYTYPMSFILYGAGGVAGETLSGMLTRVSDMTATLSTNALASLTDATLWFGDTLAETSARALKAAPHSLFAANEGTDLNISRWAKTDGWLEFGSMTTDRWSIDTPFAINFIRPGRTVFVICIISQRAATAAIPDGVKLYFGVWDATAAQDRWLEGSNFDLSVQAVGTTGATSVSYKAIAILSDGSTIESNVVTIVNSNAVLSASNYNRLTWTNAPGILDFKLYRLMGGVYKRIFTITNGASDYNDTGGEEETVAGFPTTFNTKPIVYKETSPVFPSTADWIAVGVALFVPSTYNTQNTTGKQWFRCGSVNPTPDNRSIIFDRLGVSYFQGGWDRSSRDRTLIATNNPSSSPTGSNQGNTGVNNCFSSMTLGKIRRTRDAEPEWIQIGLTEKGQYIWDGSRNYNRITRVKKAMVNRVWLVVMSGGEWAICTESERFITSRADKDGTMLRDLTFGDTIIAPSDTGVTSPMITMLEEQEGEFEVVTLTLQGGKRIFAVGNYTAASIKCLLAHNLKVQPEF